MTTNFTTKLSGPPWARSHHLRYVTYGPLRKIKIKAHARFRDDGYMTWEKAPAHDVADFFQTANNFHNLLRFTRTTSPQQFTFLDTTVYKGSRLRLNRTGYQNMHQTNWDIPVSRLSILPPQLSILWIHKRNRVSQEPTQNWIQTTGVIPW